ncbi:hypothetical protein BLNAU_8891 [Blattamonas nauphoetae]|uniref:Uncharacterized protein n=1 Tax=Blattamonas nauphoetae TaxID=2049346 RepID=A0ABQ9XXB0_9EUKA|nr:hypothetical protein BLNAU_8891 [Blattamonas nauphoetae]
MGRTRILFRRFMFLTPLSDTSESDDQYGLEQLDVFIDFLEHSTKQAAWVHDPKQAEVFNKQLLRVKPILLSLLQKLTSILNSTPHSEPTHSQEEAYRTIQNEFEEIVSNICSLLDVFDIVITSGNVDSSVFISMIGDSLSHLVMLIGFPFDSSLRFCSLLFLSRAMIQNPATTLPIEQAGFVRCASFVLEFSEDRSDVGNVIYWIHNVLKAFRKSLDDGNPILQHITLFTDHLDEYCRDLFEAMLFHCNRQTRSFAIDLLRYEYSTNGECDGLNAMEVNPASPFIFN